MIGWPSSRGSSFCFGCLCGLRIPRLLGCSLRIAGLFRRAWRLFVIRFVLPLEPFLGFSCGGLLSFLGRPTAFPLIQMRQKICLKAHITSSDISFGCSTVIQLLGKWLGRLATGRFAQEGA
jgi:hypothetical protein